MLARKGLSDFETHPQHTKGDCYAGIETNHQQYVTGDSTVQALKGIDLKFRENEFVSVLGPSGCGKTTLLNIIGGLDQYTSGDLIINGTSTKKFKNRDWDTYRNHTIGFCLPELQLDFPSDCTLQRRTCPDPVRCFKGRAPQTRH